MLLLRCGYGKSNNYFGRFRMFRFGLAGRDREIAPTGVDVVFLFVSPVSIEVGLCRAQSNLRTIQTCRLPPTL